MIQEPSSADIVNKLLSPGPSDPKVPLPRAGLGEKTAESNPATGTRIYGRAEGDGGVLGLSVPIPADRNAPNTATRYSNGAPAESPQQTR